MCKHILSLSEKSQLRILNRKLDALVDEIAHKIAGYYTNGLAVPSPDVEFWKRKVIKVITPTSREGTMHG
jgi:hypothetical protein